MTSFSSYSEVGQDRFAWAMLGHRGSGTFLDIGCGDPVKCNNSYGLSLLGWRGLLVDSDPKFIAACSHRRNDPAICADATVTLFPFQGLFGTRSIDYLSLDCDGATLGALINFLSQEISFKVATIEHDAYRDEGEKRDIMRRLLEAKGYILTVANVRCGGGEFEDWWIHPSTLA